MGLKEAVSHFAGRVYFDKPALKLSLAEHADALRRSGEEIRAGLARAAGDERQRAKLRHVIGIERWGQSRLRVFVGDAFVSAGHRPHLPPESASWEELVREFGEMRAQTIALAERLAAENATGTVTHNQFGELSAQGWLRYLNGHSLRELRGLKATG
jgi:hypothetical protein